MGIHPKPIPDFITAPDTCRVSLSLLGTFVRSRFLSSCNSLRLEPFEADVDRNYHKGDPQLTPHLQQVSAKHQTEETRPLRHQLHPTTSISRLQTQNLRRISRRRLRPTSTHDAYTIGSEGCR